MPKNRFDTLRELIHARKAPGYETAQQAKLDTPPAPPAWNGHAYRRPLTSKQRGRA